MQEKEVCWNITTKCNENCGYCHRFLNLDDLSLEENLQILENLINDGITNISWAGGESLLYPGIKELLKKANENGIKNKLITNGKILAENKEMQEIFDYLDSITLSIDSTNNDINQLLGRGSKHFSYVKKVIEIAKSKGIKVNVNTVVTSLNKNNISELGKFLNNYDIDLWRIFKFMPLREKAIENKEIYDISLEEFKQIEQLINNNNFNNIQDIQFIGQSQIENNYVLLNAQGDIVVTQNEKDVIKGNALKDRISKVAKLDFKDKYKINIEGCPDVVFIGNISFDIVDFSKVDKSKKQIEGIGGACIYSSIPASLYGRVGIIGKVGNDFDITKLYGNNIDLSGVKQIDKPTTKFFISPTTEDGQERVITGEVEPLMEVGAEDIPDKFLKAKHFHLTTARPEKQMELIEYIRKNAPQATISVDTFEGFANESKCKEVFDKVDMAFIDKEYTELLGSKAPIKIIKCGNEGVYYYSKEKEFPVYSEKVDESDIVDKTGAGDCLNGVFVNLLIAGETPETALKSANIMATESIKNEGMMNLRIPGISKGEKNKSDE